MSPPGFLVLYVLGFLGSCLTKGQVIDTSICVPVANVSAVDASPLPALSESYSTTVEWKLLHNNSTISIEEYVIGMEKLSSIRITQEGHTSRIIYDEIAQQYTTIDVVNNVCNTQNYVLDVVLFGNEIWKSTTKQLYQTLKQSITVYGGYQTIRSTVTQSWSTCVYLLEYNVTLSATLYFAAEGWPMPFAAPNAMIPIRMELRGSYNNQTRFHAIGDYVNFLSTPPSDLDNVQTEPGMFCLGKEMGKPILPVPSDFSAVIERVNTHDKQVTYETIWFDSQRKFVRYETKSASGQDVDPSRIVFDFYEGVRYSIDPYTSSCAPPTVIERGDKFVDQTVSPVTRIQMQNSLDFFKMQNATVQYVGKRYTRKIFCDVWVGLYYDLNIGQNQTVEWYFLGEGWQEGIGTSITPGSLVRFDVWAENSDFPIIHNVHKLDPSQPYLSSFDIGPCFTGEHKQNFVIKFMASGLDLSLVSLNYIKDQIQQQLTTQAQVDNIRFSNVAFDSYGSDQWYFSGVLLDKSPVDNYNIFPPVQMKEPLDSAFSFLTGFVDTPWVYSNTGQSVTFNLSAVGILPLYYPQEFTTTTTLPTTTGTFLVPTLPVQTTGTTGIPTPPPPPTGSTSKTTTRPARPTTGAPKTSTSNKTGPCNCPNTTCSGPKTCPKVTCPVISTPQPVTSAKCTTSTPCNCPKVTCPITTTQKPRECPKVTCPVETSKPATHAPCTTGVPPSGSLGAQAQQSSKGVDSGGAAGIAVACLVIGFVIGLSVMFVFKRKYPNGFRSNDGYLNPIYDDTSKY
ncbi:uncharacterized protein LOC111116201 [Crassostrea virginica]|uniref:Uncharacterized protein LOC111116201 n=1 Tax=Crassostrea virginica TaxID=6565 RepID=A0A8B8C5B7_CRAVI|nr:uncharacterized protein LOC111116201 [Crassostrea virginica]XP_022310906.1 uncharacterized protein LOC111116201 [Crassostrea virginica]